MKEINILTITDNHGNKRKVYEGLPIGTKLKAKREQKSYRITAGGEMDFDCITKDKIYVVNYIQKWNWQGDIPCVNDESNCVCWAEIDLFELV